MKIKRVINGTEMEFELTYCEMMDAYTEYQHECDLEDIEGAFDGIGDDELMETYGVNMETIKPLINTMVYRYRKCRDNGDGWINDRDWAIDTTIDEYKKENGYA